MSIEYLEIIKELQEILREIVISQSFQGIINNKMIERIKDLEKKVDGKMPKELMPDDKGFCDNNPLGGTIEVNDIEAEKGE